MALPFILGLAVGAGAVIAFNKSDKIKKVLGAGVEKTKDVATDVKDTMCATVDCIKEKKNKNESLCDEPEIEIEKEEEK